MTQPHGPPEVDRTQHDVAHTHVQLVSDGEVLLGPDKVPVPTTDELEYFSQKKVTFTITEME